MRGYLIYTGVSLLVAAANCHAQPSFYLRQCGDYEVNARVSCDQGSCTLTVVPGSQGQTVLQLKTTPLVYPQYANSFIHARVRISSLSGAPVQVEALDSIPRRTVPQWSTADLHPVRVRKCAP